MGNKAWPANCRSVRSPPNSVAPAMKPIAAITPRCRCARPRSVEDNRSDHGGGMKQQHRRRRAEARAVGLMRGQRGEGDARGAHQACDGDECTEESTRRTHERS